MFENLKVQFSTLCNYQVGRNLATKCSYGQVHAITHARTHTHRARVKTVCCASIPLGGAQIICMGNVLHPVSMFCGSGYICI